jgi:hypothetical protein
MCDNFAVNCNTVFVYIQNPNFNYYLFNLPLANRNSANAFDFGKVAPSCIGGPKTGTSFDLLTATLNPNHHHT